MSFANQLVSRIRHNLPRGRRATQESRRIQERLDAIKRSPTPSELFPRGGQARKGG